MRTFNAIASRQHGRKFEVFGADRKRLVGECNGILVIRVKEAFWLDSICPISVCLLWLLRVSGEVKTVLKVQRREKLLLCQTRRMVITSGVA